MLLHVVPKRWLSLDYRLEDEAGQSAGELSLSVWRRRGTITFGGQRYRAHRNKTQGELVLEAEDGSELARAVKPGALRRAFSITHDGLTYGLSAVSAGSRTFALSLAGCAIVTVSPVAWWSRRARVEDTMSEPRPPVLAFAVWLTMFLWNRDIDIATWF